MRTQAIYIEDRRTWGDTGPLTDKINVSNPISAIDVIIRAANGATSNQGNPLHIDVDRVEIVDGTDRIHSLSLVQGIIQHCYENGRYPANILDEAAAAVQEEGYRINFGRFLGDPDYWLDPTMFRNLAYRLTGDLTISGTVGFATGTRDITLVAHTMPGHTGGKRGTMMMKEMDQFTSAASGDVRVDLPDDFPYRSIGLRAFETGIAFHVDITNFKLTKGKDSFVYADIRSETFRDLLQMWRGEFEVTQQVFRTDADTPGVFMAYPRWVYANSLLDLNVTNIDALTIDQANLGVISVTAAPAIAKETGDIATLLAARGTMPHFGGLWTFGNMNDPEDWPAGDDIKDLELVLTQGGAGAACSVWANQIRP